MAKFFLKGKWKKRAVTALSVALSLTLSAGILTACGKTTDSSTTEDDTKEEISETDNQTLKNGNFEFYSDKQKDLDEKKTLLYSPTDWSFTSGSPSSDTRSGIINLNEWETLTKSTHSLCAFESLTSEQATEDEAKKAVSYAIEHWDDASIYDRLKFITKYDAKFTSNKLSSLEAGSAEKEHFDKYNYSIDFEDVEKLAEEVKELKTPHDGDADRADETNMLMIHNYRSDSGVFGTGQYYTSSTTITLAAGTAAEVSVYVRTDSLTHYYASDKLSVQYRAGAYIGVTNTVGGTTLDQMQIKNINTNGAWQKYTVCVRASSYASSTFKIVLGLGQSTSDNRYEAVNGYAFFDDITCKRITSEAYDAYKEAKNPMECTVHSISKDKLFDATEFGKNEYALDLNATSDFSGVTNAEINTEETKEVSGGNTYTAPVKENENDIYKAVTYKELNEMKADNKYLSRILEDDFKNFPFLGANDDAGVIMLLSVSGKPYTATLKNNAEFTLAPEEHKLVSFWTKTSSIRSGKTGAAITLVDGENKSTISAFDSTKANKVDLEDEKDIYDGWVQCFFFVENDTKTDKTFHLEFNYGPTTIAGTKNTDYCDGYAAFTNLEIASLTKTQYGYASSGSYTKTVSLTGEVTPTAKFDDYSVTSNIETGFATPVKFSGVQSGTINVVPTPDGKDPVNNPTKQELTETWGIYTGLLNAKYADTYREQVWASGLSYTGNSGEEFWRGLFGDGENSAKVANQPLVIFRDKVDGITEDPAPSYGYFANTATVSANSYRKISMRVKAQGVPAFIYLIDTSDAKAGFNTPVTPVAQSVTYWYDDEGNIVKSDPSEKSFNARKDTLFFLQDNGLYKSADTTDGNYYANLAAFKTDEETGDLIRTDSSKAFYKYGDNYYAYYDKDKTGADAYSTVVKDLKDAPTPPPARYTAPSDETLKSYAMYIEVPAGNGWTDVEFYIHTGNKAKDYRLEVWAGDRDGVNKIPTSSYVIFDDFASEDVSSDYENLLNEAVANLKDVANAGKRPGDEGYLGADDELTANALYSVFTFYDAPSYQRYDKTLDTDSLGNPYGSYKQSEQKSKLIALNYKNGNVLSKFVDFSAYDVEVAKDDLTPDKEPDQTDTKPASETNIWLLISSGVMAGALILVIVILIVRKIVSATRGNKPTKPKKTKKSKKPVLIED